MTHLAFPCTCRHCAGPLTIVNQAQPTTGESVAVLECGPYVELFARQPRLGWDSWGYGFEAAS